MKFGLTENDLNYLLKTFEKAPQVERAILFGSRAMGNFKPGSDVDIALDGSEINFDITAHLHFLLEEESPMPYFFDIVDLKHLEHEGLKEHILKYGVVLYEKSQ